MEKKNNMSNEYIGARWAMHVLSALSDRTSVYEKMKSCGVSLSSLDCALFGDIRGAAVKDIFRVLVDAVGIDVAKALDWDDCLEDARDRAYRIVQADLDKEKESKQQCI